MGRNLLVAAFLFLAFIDPATLAARASLQDPSSPAPASKPSSDPGAQPAAPQAKPATPQKPHVYTNDDMKGGSDGGTLDFGQINDCDRNCFEQVRQLSHVIPLPNSNWKRDLLHAIDIVRKDAEWQQYLNDLYNMHVKFCALGDAKRAELNRVADPHNVTPQELSVDEKYDRKFKELQNEMQSLTSRQGALLARFAINAYSQQFANLQVSRISNAPCGYQPRYQPDNDEDP